MSKTIEDAVRSKYASVALSGLSSDQAGVQAVAEAFGYSPEELSSIPAEANMGVSCGNPTAFASLKPGEVVVDLGSGGGLDVFLAAQQVGPTGKAIGIDMTPEMIDLARRNLAKSKGPDGQPLANVEFHLATIDRMPLPDASVDCVISNCVLNLVPDKPAALPRDRPRAEAGRAAGRERHRPEATAPSGTRSGHDGLRRLHRRGHPDRGVSPALARGGLCPRPGGRDRGGPERLRQDREPGELLRPGTREGLACRG